MSDYNERACTNCGSYLHHEDDCPRDIDIDCPWCEVFEEEM